MQNRILHITQFLSPGGLERMVLCLCEELIAKGHDSEVFVYDQEGEKTLLPQFIASGIPTYYHQKKKGFCWSTVKELRKLIKSKKFSAIHSHDLGSLIYASLANFGLSTVTHVHTQHSFIHFKKGKKLAVYEKIFTFFPDYIVVVSPHQLEDYKKLGVKRAQVITNGISYPKENPFTLRLPEMRAKLLKDSRLIQPGVFGPVPKVDSCWILVPGRIQHSKGQYLLFKIMDGLTPEELSKVHFIIIGAPTNEIDRVLLENLHKSRPEFQNSLSYLGFHSNPLDWMIASNGVVLLSQFEGFPLVPLESIGLGVPTLLSDIAPHLFFRNEAELTSLTHLENAIHWVKEIVRTSFHYTDRETDELANENWIKNAPFRKKHSIAVMTSEYISLYEKKNDRRNFQFKLN
jgi:glycosyltransferase involved in cell wall biosynthesis